MRDFKRLASQSPHGVVMNGNAPPLSLPKLLVYSLLMLVSCLFLKDAMSIIDSLGSRPGSRGTTLFGSHKIGLMMVLLGGIGQRLYVWLDVGVNMIADSDSDDDDDNDSDTDSETEDDSDSDSDGGIMQDKWRNWLYYFILHPSLAAHLVRLVLGAFINTILCSYGESLCKCIQTQVFSAFTHDHGDNGEMNYSTTVRIPSCCCFVLLVFATDIPGFDSDVVVNQKKNRMEKIFNIPSTIPLPPPPPFFSFGPG